MYGYIYFNLPVKAWWWMNFNLECFWFYLLNYCKFTRKQVYLIFLLPIDYDSQEISRKNVCVRIWGIPKWVQVFVNLSTITISFSWLKSWNIDMDTADSSIVYCNLSFFLTNNPNNEKYRLQRITQWQEHTHYYLYNCFDNGIKLNYLTFVNLFSQKNR